MRQSWRVEHLEDRRLLAAGDLDSTFGTGGLVTTDFETLDDRAEAVAVEPDGQVVVVGHAASETDLAVARYNADGSPDLTFGSGGRVTVSIGGSISGRAIVLQGDGKIVVAGHVNLGSGADFAVIRVNSDGSLDDDSDDDGFGGDGIVTTDLSGVENFAEGVTIDSDGRVIVVGRTDSGDGSSDFAVVRYTDSGNLDTSFGTGGIVRTDFNLLEDEAFDVAIDGDGKILVAGHSFSASNNSNFALARYLDNGSLDALFDIDGKVTTDVGSGSLDFGKSLALHADGKIVVAGQTIGAEADLAAVRYNTDGSPDASFGTGGDGIVTIDFGSANEFGEDVVIQPDGKIIVGGSSEQSIDDFDFAIARLNNNGTFDASFNGDGKVTTDFGNNLQDQAFGLALQSDGKIIAAGFSQSAESGNDFAVARYLGDSLGLPPDACDPTKTQLVVNGTSGDDTIKIHNAGPGLVEVTLNGASLGTFDPTGRIIVFAGAGDDDIQVSGSINNSAWLYGGADDDHIKGGAGNDVLLGGDGDDMVVGGSGRDLLIGGAGRDRLVGNSDDDILVAGFTDHDDNEEALCHIMEEWTRTDASFCVRVLHLEGPGEGGCSGGLNEPYFLNDETVHDDGVQDVLTGSSGCDWFLFNWDGDCNSVSRDKATDLHLFEAMFAEDIDFINSTF